MWVLRRRQAGATMVEFAIGVAIFFALIFGIISLALSFYSWNRVSEAARAGIRFLVVNDSLAPLVCPSASTLTVSCGGGACAGLMGVIANRAPFVQAANVSVSYSCSTAGSSVAPDTSLTRSVSLTISGVDNPFSLPGLTGFVPVDGGFLAVLPAITTTRVSEDLYTP